MVRKCWSFTLLAVSPITWLYGLTAFGIAIVGAILGLTGAVVNQKYAGILRSLGGVLMVGAGSLVVIGIRINSNFLGYYYFGALLVFGGMLAPLQQFKENSTKKKLK